VLLAVLAIGPPLAAQELQNEKHLRYSVTDLGTLGGTFSIGRGINNKGWATGNAFLRQDTAQHAVLWRTGRKIDLGTLGGPNSNTFWGPNERGQVAGQAETSTPDPLGEDFCFFGTQLICLPFLWQKGVMTALPTLGGNNGTATNINNRGQVVGLAENATLDSTCPTSEYQAEAVIWENGAVRELPTVSGDPDGYVYGVNDKGQTVGGSGDCAIGPAFSLHALLWQKDGTVTDLGNLGGSLYSGAVGVNGRGQVIGSSDLPGDTNFFAVPFSNTHGFFWENGVIADLGTLPGDATSFPDAINNNGEVVGGGSRAVLWQDGVPRDLNTLVPGPPFSPLYLLDAFDINASGEIVGFGLAINGELHAFLATPCDEDHAYVESCKQGAAVTTAEEPIQLEPGTESPPALTRRDRWPGGRFGGMVGRFRAPQFPEHQLPSLGNGPTR
jgi:probable HAF family extracellular repeat protein